VGEKRSGFFISSSAIVISFLDIITLIIRKFCALLLLLTSLVPTKFFFETASVVVIRQRWSFGIPCGFIHCPCPLTQAIGVVSSSSGIRKFAFELELTTPIAWVSGHGQWMKPQGIPKLQR
jgi:hypothetical protein